MKRCFSQLKVILSSSLCIVAIVALLGGSGCFASDVLLLNGKQDHPVEQEAIRKLAELYGFKVEVAQATSQRELKSAGDRRDIVAVFASADALAELAGNTLLAALQTKGGRQIPLLVFGVSSSNDSRVLKRWSDGQVLECASLPRDFQPDTLRVNNVGTITASLSGAVLPAVTTTGCRLQATTESGGQVILALHQEPDTNIPVLVRIPFQSGEAFFVPEIREFDDSWRGDQRGLAKAFSYTAPFALFLSHAAGTYAWHLDGHYANLTIDDAWLIQPYGHLDFQALLGEMEKHDFHTTIAFIPWNFDRSRPDVATLVRTHPSRFSICIHGNDHAHREFGDYRVNSLEDQVADTKQGIARMERFHEITGIPYDRFMVFPHGIAPEKTFEALKKYDFLGTANAVNVPLDVAFPKEPAFLFRPFTVAYAGFLSFYRYPAVPAISESDLAIQAFLGNPLLFYGHENLFNSGTAAFNVVVDRVKRVQPDVKWASLGEIARHTHLIRSRSDGDFDVLMLSNEADLVNPTNHEAVFHVQVSDDFMQDLKSVQLDGATTSFTRANSTLTVLIPAGHTREIRIQHWNDLDIAREDIRHTDVYSYSLRMVSDLRDLYLSRFSWGRAVKKAYYDHGWDSFEFYLEQNWWVAAILFATILAFFYRGRRAKKRSLGRVATD